MIVLTGKLVILDFVELLCSVVSPAHSAARLGTPSAALVRLTAVVVVAVLVVVLVVSDVVVVGRVVEVIEAACCRGVVMVVVVADIGLSSVRLQAIPLLKELQILDVVVVVVLRIPLPRL